MAGDPVLDLGVRALGAAAMSAGVVPDSLDMAVRAGLNMTSQLRSTTCLDRRSSSMNSEGLLVTASVRLEVLAEDLLEYRAHTDLMAE